MSFSLFNPFLFYSHQLQELFSSAIKQKNPAWWLYQNKTRSILFMLEALTRLHGEAFEKKLYINWNNRLKKLEDIFGAIDEYDAFVSEFKSNKKISKQILSCFSEQNLKSIEKCNKRLQNKHWLTQRLTSFDTKIEQEAIIYDTDYFGAIKKAIRKEITAIKTFCEERDYIFTYFEEEVHEIRRKLRWLSMYAQAMNGMIQLKTNKRKPVYSTNYFTKKIITSPYNKLHPKPNAISEVIEYRKDSFYALSWMIDKLEGIKDKGLNIEILAEALCHTENIPFNVAKEKALNILQFNPHTEKELLKKASEMLQVFIAKDKVLDQLLV